MKRVAILGSTGSIGTQTLDVIGANPEQFSVSAISAVKSIDKLIEQAKRFRPRVVVVQEERDVQEVATALPECEVLCGDDGLIAAATDGEVDLVVGAIVGFACLRPILAAISAGKDIAIANKECFVAAGELVMNELKRTGVRLVPIDSEHSSIYQCLSSRQVPAAVRRIVLTASGGPFLRTPIEQLRQVTPEQAVKHPRWAMGAKISVDSANLMNKGLEVIEAAWIFDLPAEKIAAIIHPQSIVHGLVEYEDNAVIACLFETDMRLPISYALGMIESEERLPRNNVPLLDLGRWEKLEFVHPDYHRFPALGVCYEALKAGGTVPAVLNAANEVAVAGFLNKKIGFLKIVEIVEETLSRYSKSSADSIGAVLEADRWGRETASSLLGSI